MTLPEVVVLAEDLAVPDEAGAVLVEELLALAALQAGCVPLQVGGHSEDVLVVNLRAATHAQSGYTTYKRKKENKEKKKREKTRVQMFNNSIL